MATSEKKSKDLSVLTKYKRMASGGEAAKKRRKEIAKTVYESAKIGRGIIPTMLTKEKGKK